MKLREKVHDTATKKTKKVYYEARTPYQRLMEHPKVLPEAKAQLQTTYESLNPITLQAQIQIKLERIYKTLRSGS